MIFSLLGVQYGVCSKFAMTEIGEVLHWSTNSRIRATVVWYIVQIFNLQQHPQLRNRQRSKEGAIICRAEQYKGQLKAGCQGGSPNERHVKVLRWLSNVAISEDYDYYSCDC